MTRPLNIGMPTSTFLPSLGGAEVGLHNIATRLVARGHAPVVIAPAPHCRDLREIGWSLSYRVESFPPKVWGVLRHAPAIGYAILDRVLARLDQRHELDVWHGTIGYPTGTALVHYASAHNRPHLVRCAGEDIQRDTGIGYGMRLNPRIDAQITTWLPRADRLVAITESVADEYRGIGADDASIAGIPNGVDLDRFAAVPDRRAFRAAHGIDSDAFLYLCVGRNHPKKNFDGLLQAFARLPAKCGALAIVGAGVNELNGLAAELEIADRVHLIETLTADRHDGAPLALPSEELVAMYRSADVFVFPSRLETFGIVLVEAMAAGLPVLTTDAPGCRDIVRAGIDGLTVPVDDIDDMTASMRRLHEQPELRTKLADAARQRAKAFSWDTITDSYIALYRELIAARAGGMSEAA